MLAKTLSVEYNGYYQACKYQERIDMLAASLANLKYSGDVVDQHVHEWLRFSRYCDNVGIDIPSSIYAQEINDYVRWRLPSGSESRHRFIRASLRILIEADDRGKFDRRIHAQSQPTTPLFKMWVIPYVDFLKKHRGICEKTCRKSL